MNKVADNYGILDAIDVLDVAKNAVNQLLPNTIYIKINDKYIPRQTLGDAYIEDGAVWVDLEPVKGQADRIRTRQMRWSKPEYV